MQAISGAMTTPILLLTRPEAASLRFSAQVGAGVEMLISPLLRIDLREVGNLTPDLRGIILTSENGAVAAGRIPGLPRRAFCVGDRTAAVARDAGFDPTSAGGDAQALVALILSERESGPLLHIRGEHAGGDIAERLNAAGVVTVEVVAYRQQEQPLSPAAYTAMQGRRAVILPLFSPRTVSILAQQGPFSAPLHAVCISTAVAEQAKSLRPLSMMTAASPNARSMALAVRTCIDQMMKG